MIYYRVIERTEASKRLQEYAECVRYSQRRLTEIVEELNEGIEGNSTLGAPFISRAGRLVAFGYGGNSIPAEFKAVPRRYLKVKWSQPASRLILPKKTGSFKKQARELEELRFVGTLTLALHMFRLDRMIATEGRSRLSGPGLVVIGGKFYIQFVNNLHENLYIQHGDWPRGLQPIKTSTVKSRARRAGVKLCM